MRLVRPLAGAFALASAFIPFTSAIADRPDRPPVSIISVSNGIDSSVGILNTSSTGGLTIESLVACSGTSGSNSVTVYGALADPDQLGNKSNKLSGKQGAYVEVQASFSDGVTFTQSGSAKVASCKASWKVSDDNKNLDYIDGNLNSGSYSLTCSDGLETALGLDVAQTAMFNSVFPDGVSCKGKGAPFFGCFRGDTMVATEAGPRPIRDVDKGDRVWSWDQAQGKKVLARVTQRFAYPSHELRTLVADGQTFHVTDRHPFWVEGRGWVEAARLASGDKLRTSAGETLAVRTNERADALAFYEGYDATRDLRAAMLHPLFRLQHASTAVPASVTGMVYNIEVEGQHNYFVGDRQVLVHNK